MPIYLPTLKIDYSTEYANYNFYKRKWSFWCVDQNYCGMKFLRGKVDHIYATCMILECSKKGPSHIAMYVAEQS